MRRRVNVAKPNWIDVDICSELFVWLKGEFSAAAAAVPLRIVEWGVTGGVSS
jgi:hypothetical protein